MYDSQHLLKNTGNNLKCSGYAFGQDKTVWQHTVEFYYCDSKLPIRMAPKLTHQLTNFFFIKCETCRSSA